MAIVSLPLAISFMSPEAAELAEADALLAEAAVLAEALAEVEALFEELPEEQPTRASAATKTPSAARTRYLLTFMILPFIIPSLALMRTAYNSASHGRKRRERRPFSSFSPVAMQAPHRYNEKVHGSQVIGTR